MSTTRRWFELAGRKQEATGDKDLGICGVKHEVAGRSGRELVDEAVIRGGVDVKALGGERGGLGSPRLRWCDVIAGRTERP